MNFPVNPNLVDARIPAAFVQCHLQVEGRLKDICKSFDIKVISYFRLISDCIFYNVIKHTALKSGKNNIRKLGFNLSFAFIGSVMSVRQDA